MEALMNTLDVILLIILAFFVIKGLIRGILFEALTLAGLITAYFLATKEMGFLAVWFSRHLPLPPAPLTIISFSLIFIFIVVMTRLIAGAVSRLIKKTPVAWLDRTGGVAFGLFKGALIASLIALLISILPLSKPWETRKDKSYLYTIVLPIAPAVFNFTVKNFPRAKSFCEEIREVLESSSESVKRYLMQKQLDELQNQLEKSLHTSGDTHA